MWTNTTQQLIQGVMQHGPDILEHCLCSDDLAQYLDRIYKEHLDYPVPPNTIYKPKWFIPEDYCPNLVEFLFKQCETEEQKDRVEQELKLYIKHEMIELLHVMKYIVDTLRTNNVLWGVGRGSSVASYVLFLIGVHKIDSVKYKLPITEFFKGE